MNHRLAYAILALSVAGCAAKTKKPKPFDACAEMKTTAGQIRDLERANQDYQALVAPLNPADSAEAEKITGYRIRIESNEEKIRSLWSYNKKNSETCDEQRRREGFHHYKDKEKEDFDRR